MDATLLHPLIVHAALTFLAAHGALQTAALRNGLEGLAWPVGAPRRRLGYWLAGLSLALALAARVATALTGPALPPILFGPAVAIGCALALALAIPGAALRLWLGRGHRGSPTLPGQQVELGPMKTSAILYAPEGDGPFPAVGLVPDPTTPRDDATPLIQALLERGVAVLHLGGRMPAKADRLALQGLVALGVSHLARRKEIDAARVGLAGVGLGGDLALRSAAMDPDVAAAMAIEPVLSAGRPGMGLDALRALSWFAARRRARRWRRSRLVRELNGLEAAVRIGPRPAAIVVGHEKGTQDRVAGLEIVRAAGPGAPLPGTNPEVVERAAGWIEERLS